MKESEGKRKRGDPEESGNKWSVKPFPNSREITGFARTQAILLSICPFTEANNSVLNVPLTHCPPLMDTLPLYPLLFASPVCVYAFPLPIVNSSVS